ncbi:MAG: DUF1015 domain-containing protein [Acidobacteria bacterium]|nr:DUF1015 domain-containing protein [Acidobacteriota bacterium]
MARISPFRPYRYTASAGSLDNLVTQPYDKIYPDMRKRYLSLSPHNLVRVILGEKQEGDNESNNVYTRAAGHFNQWIAEGILARDAEPGYFAYFQEFTLPDGGERLTRKGFIGLGGVEEYSANIVHRHELTLAGPKKDRMEVLKHTHAHFGQIFMLYPDHEGAIDRILDAAAAGEPVCVVNDEYGATHRLWKITGAAAAEITALMADKKLLIADGHHRYETSLAFHHANPGMAGAAFTMMTFVNMYSPGLKILGTHRLVKNLPDFDGREFLKAASADFRVQAFENDAAMKAAWAGMHKDVIRIGVVISGESKAYLLECDRENELDVKVLHGVILREHLGISDEAVRDERHLKYVRGADPAIADVRNGNYQVGFLLNPPSVDQTADISFGGGVMPQKSTDFYPKLLSGMAIYKVDEGAPQS